MLNLASQRVTISVSGDQVEIDERTMLGRTRDFVKINDIASINYHVLNETENQTSDLGEMEFKLKSNPPIRFSYLLNERDLTWLIFHLKRVSFGNQPTRPKAKPALK